MCLLTIAGLVDNDSELMTAILSTEYQNSHGTRGLIATFFFLATVIIFANCNNLMAGRCLKNRKDDPNEVESDQAAIS